MSTPPVPIFRRKGAGRPSQVEVAKRPVGRPAGEAAIMKGFRDQLLASENGTRVLNKIFALAMNDEHPQHFPALKFLGERLLPLGTFEREAGKSNVVKVTVTTADGTTVMVGGEEQQPEPETVELEAEDVRVIGSAEVEELEGE